MIASALHRNGTETFMINVLRRIDRKKIMIDFLIYEHDDNGYEQEARDLGSRIFLYSPRSKGLFSYANSLRKFFRDHAHEYQAVHFNGNSFTDMYHVQLAKKYSVPVRIVHSHNTGTHKLHNILFHKLHRKNIHKIATHYLACSKSAKEWGFRNSKVYDKSLVIPNGIDLDEFNFNKNYRTDIRKEFNIENSSFVICHTGTFRPVKNHPFIIEIFENIKAQREDAVLILCGAGGNIEEIKNLVHSKGLQDSIKFIGVRKDVSRILSASDAYLFPSQYEGLPFALIEAQTSGIPIFASDTISDEIKLTDNFYFLSLNLSPKDWANRILEEDYTSRKSGDRKLLNAYDINKTIEILTNIYINNK